MTKAPPETAAGTVGSDPGKRVREWLWIWDGIIVLASAVVAIVWIWVAALAWWPFAGMVGPWSLGALLAVLLQASLGSLVVGSLIELIHREWTDFQGVDHLVIYAVTLLLIGADVGFSWWAVGQVHGWVRWAYAGLVLVGVIFGGLASWFKLWPTRHRHPARSVNDEQFPAAPAKPEQAAPETSAAPRSGDGAPIGDRDPERAADKPKRWPLF